MLSPVLQNVFTRTWKIWKHKWPSFQHWWPVWWEFVRFSPGLVRRRWHPTPVLLAGKSHGRRSLVGCSPWGREESDTTKRLHFHFSLSHIGEGNGNPLQCSCLENPRDGGTWWAAVCGDAQSWTRLKRLSSSSSSITIYLELNRQKWQWVLNTPRTCCQTLIF